MTADRTGRRKLVLDRDESSISFHCQKQFLPPSNSPCLGGGDGGDVLTGQALQNCRLASIIKTQEQDPQLSIRRGFQFPKKVGSLFSFPNTNKIIPENAKETHCRCDKNNWSSDENSKLMPTNKLKCCWIDGGALL